MDTNTHANGKSHVHPSHQTSILAVPEEDTDVSDILNLVKDAIEQELALKATMRKLQQAMKSVAQDELPSVLMALAGMPLPAPVPTVTVSSKPGLAKAESPFYSMDTWKGKVVALMTDGRERKTQTIVKTLKAGKRHKSSVYHAVSQLLGGGVLEKTAYAHYRIKR